ncbi:MAG TPA: hypothetical protein VK502_02560 [Candidatus Saccharimonadales bacterium]|nr:hypothetical protein [Candidatus Saccharimonadales bacterium]
MKKEYTQTLSTPMGRVVTYLCVFVAGSVIADLLPHLVTVRTMVPGLLILAACIVMGAVFANERHTLSRITSAATLFVLGAIAIRVGYSAIPDAYLFAAALCIALLGAQSFLHRKLANLKRTVLYSSAIILVSLILVAALTYGATELGRIAAA